MTRLVFKYGRKEKEQKSLSEKFARLSFHSMVKKSNRLSMKLSNAFKISEMTVLLTVACHNFISLLNIHSKIDLVDT